jgi:(Z)-2-((N-methylformamido)methylene)-5-hydroxybutyrolactone dehydrogenase
MKRHQMLIGGQWVDAAGGEVFETENPFLGKAWALVPRASAVDVDRAVAAARKAFKAASWSELSATARGALLRKLADLIAAEAERLAEIEVGDNGKLITEMRAQLRYVVPQWFHYFGGLADKIEGRVIPIDKPGMVNFTREEPLGVVAAITPWNSPLMLAAWKLAPALAAGNTVVWKPSEFSFDRTGQSVYEQAARSIKRVTLELGGKSANIVFKDAALDNAVKGVVSGIFAATGQTCIAGSRALIHRPIHNEFVDRLVALGRTARMGDPLLDTTQVGPVTTRPQYKKVLDYIDVAQTEGATCVLGGSAATRPECGNGWFVEPTVFTDVKPTMRIAQEEVFGPVLSIIPFDDEEEAVAIANDTQYGLAAGVWTQSIKTAFTMSRRLEAGTVWINTYRATSYLSPFGGYKRSGIGRESGLSAIREYLQEKSVWIDTVGEVPNPFVMR